MNLLKGLRQFSSGKLGSKLSSPKSIKVEVIRQNTEERRPKVEDIPKEHRAKFPDLPKLPKNVYAVAGQKARDLVISASHSAFQVKK